MANRYVPFGYEITDGKYAVIEREKMVIENIFGLYINGKSFAQISDRMNDAGVSYNNDGRHWNKNMVKRILENKRYIGEKDYPQIIADETFNAAEKIRLSKFTPPGDEEKELLDFYREKLVCRECGCSLMRYKGCKDRTGGTHSYRRCSNENCAENKSPVNEKKLNPMVAETLNHLIDNYEQIKGVDETISEQSIAITRLENELADDMEKMAVDIENTVRKITELAEMRFNNAPECDYSAIDEKIKRELSIHSKSEKPDVRLLKNIVKRMTYSKDKMIEMELINGYEVSGGEQNGAIGSVSAKNGDAGTHC